MNVRLYIWKETSWQAGASAKRQSDELGAPSVKRDESMSLFTRKCAWCGAKLSNPAPVERMGKPFCSEQHAESYLAQTRAADGADESGGCG